MKKFRKYVALGVLAGIITLLCVACSSEVDVQKVYRFELQTMPVQKRIVMGETAEIRCRLVREGDYDEARYFIRYFQPDGRGELHLDDGMVFAPNDLYPLDNMVFRLYYTSHCTDQQTIDIYVEDNYGQVVQESFSFQNERTDGDEQEE
ncbi:MAG: DUF3872 domain-containing protein [Rikenellaceae bacterium]|nr:DUF3872 domain-containing protein [Rikenellaceae bacterium]